MKIILEDGRYVVAVSGGVDSVVLLDLLTREKGLILAVAHFDHGIRDESYIDRDFVEQLAAKYGLEFYSEDGNLGNTASEEQARIARYNFLERVKDEFNAQMIITAHHQDDLLETAALNILRGTGRKGLSSLKSTKSLLRPLLNYSKEEIIEYALKNNLNWVEDKTNLDTKYRRNYVRHELLGNLSDNEKDHLIDVVHRTDIINKEIDKALNAEINNHMSKDEMDRYWFVMLPHDLSEEIMAQWLRNSGLASFDRKTINRSVIAAKTLKPGKKSEIYKNFKLLIEDKSLKIIK
ncbi:MAG: tRNA lysidine(34) synthetase TilS [bacterium]